MNISISLVQFGCSFTQHKMLMMLGAVAVLLVPLASLAEGNMMLKDKTLILHHKQHLCAIIVQQLFHLTGFP